MKGVFILIVMLFPFLAQAQDSTITVSVVVHEDPRIDLIVHKPAPKHFSGKASGYRIQIYNGNDRDEANKIKLNFMQLYPETRAYLTYHNPQFRVRVGDFRTRKAASEFLRTLSGRFSTMIVPETIFIAPVK